MASGPSSSAAALASAAASVPPLPPPEETIILPPPTALNPLPALPVALGLDNREQLLQTLLLSSGMSGDAHRQLLVFGSSGLRTLLLRQVLGDLQPSFTASGSNTSKAQLLPHKKKKKASWDAVTSFPNLPKSIVGTRVVRMQDGGVHDSGGGGDGSTGDVTTTEEDWLDSTTTAGSGSSASIDGADLITYFVRPSDLHATQVVARYVRNLSQKKKNVHHRLVYIPQVTALVQKVLDNLGVSSLPNASIHSLPLDLFPLETDVVSLEVDEGGGSRDTLVEHTPSLLVQTCARALLKWQDVVGPFPRIQGYGAVAEDVIRALLSRTIDEHLADERHHKESPEDPSNATASYGANSRPHVATNPNQVSALIVLDRKVDLVTPLLTPLTYEGLLDDVIGLDCGYLHIDVDVLLQDETDPPPPSTTTSSPSLDPTASQRGKKESGMVALPLNGSDALYSEVRDQHVEKFGTFLQNQAKALQESHANFALGGAKKDLSQIHQFVKQIPVFTQNLRSLTNHIHLAELVKRTTQSPEFREQWQLERSILEGESCLDQLEELLASQYPPLKWLRLLCLQSLCQGGIKAARYDALRRDLVQTYGYEYLFAVHHLERAGLLSRREGLWVDATSSSFAAWRTALHLIHADVDTVEPDDIAYVSSGYAPLSVRIVQTAVKGWSHGREELLKETPSGGGVRMVDVVQHRPPEDLAMALRRKPHGALAPHGGGVQGTGADAPGPDGAPNKKKPILVVFYVGGVTYMELASLRFLSRRPTFPFHIVCLTTKILNGGTMVRNLG